MNGKLIMSVVAGWAIVLAGVIALADDKGTTVIVAPPPAPPPVVAPAPVPPSAVAAPAGEFVVRRLIKLEEGPVYGANGEKIGKIDGLAVDATRGQIAYAVLSFGGVLGMGDKNFVVPWSSLGKRIDSADYDHATYTLNVDKDRLKGAPGFDKDWPDMDDIAWGRQIHSYWNQQPYWEARPPKDVHVHVGPIHVDVHKERHPVLRGEPVAPPPAPVPVAPAVVVKSHELVDHAVLDSKGVKFAELKAVMTDPQSGRLVYGVLKVTNAAGFSGDDRYAAPWAVFEVRSKVGGEERGKVASGRDAFDVIFNAPLDRLRSGPRFHEDNWPNMDMTWGEGVYQAYGVRPFWR
jgi:sporulation protein YlmC with PRC-barrel domain